MSTLYRGNLKIVKQIKQFNYGRLSYFNNIHDSGQSTSINGPNVFDMK